MTKYYSKKPLVENKLILYKFSKVKITDLCLSVRLYNCLLKYEYKIKTVEDLLKLSDFEIIAMKGMGQTCFRELKNELISINALK